ncbi:MULTISPECIES: hypothetical protein [Haloprofundus]|nr:MULTISPECIES: hypothetical protein [Haloprofundus]
MVDLTLSSVLLLWIAIMTAVYAGVYLALQMFFGQNNPVTGMEEQNQ